MLAPIENGNPSLGFQKVVLFVPFDLSGTTLITDPSLLWNTSPGRALPAYFYIRKRDGFPLGSVSLWNDRKLVSQNLYFCKSSDLA